MSRNSMDLLELLSKRGMDAEVSARVGAGFRERNLDRVIHRNGYRGRDWDTRIGTEDSGWDPASSPGLFTRRT